LVAIEALRRWAVGKYVGPKAEVTFSRATGAIDLPMGSRQAVLASRRLATHAELAWIAALSAGWCLPADWCLVSWLSTDAARTTWAEWAEALVRWLAPAPTLCRWSLRRQQAKGRGLGAATDPALGQSTVRHEGFMLGLVTQGAAQQQVHPVCRPKGEVSRPFRTHALDRKTKSLTDHNGMPDHTNLAE